MSLGEFDVINTYFKRPAKHTSVIQSVGDDCAVLSIPENHQLVVSMDTLVAGRHFPKDASPEHIAQRAFCTCLSDLAAMGAAPQWFTLGLTLPESDSIWLQSFSESLLNIADEYQCDLVGGDTTQGPLTITLQVHGLVKAGCALTRSAAQAGDKVFVTGCLGDGAAALEVLLNPSIKVDVAVQEYLSQRFYCPEPQIKSGRLLVDYANAAIDISDGLLSDCQHIANASAVDIKIDVSKIPLSSAYRAVVNEAAIDKALVGGDDYQLVFTVSEQHYSSVNRFIKDKVLDATEIGQVLNSRSAKPVVHCVDSQGVIDIKIKQGYQHFAS
ncbi:MAG: thiamine-phosphate kinase [Cellvibrionaceae bacterium]